MDAFTVTVKRDNAVKENSAASTKKIKNKRFKKKIKQYVYHLPLFLSNCSEAFALFYLPLSNQICLDTESIRLTRQDSFAYNILVFGKAAIEKPDYVNLQSPLQQCRYDHLTLIDPKYKEHILPQNVFSNRYYCFESN